MSLAHLVSSRSCTPSFVATFLHGITSVVLICEFQMSALRSFAIIDATADYMPVFFQACLGASPIRSSVDILPVALVMTPFAMLCGIIIKVTQKYRPVNYLGWILLIIGFGLLTLLRPESPTAKWAGFQFIAAAGTGIIVRSYALTARRSLTYRHS